LLSHQVNLRLLFARDPVKVLLDLPQLLLQLVDFIGLLRLKHTRVQSQRGNQNRHSHNFHPLHINSMNGGSEDTKLAKGLIQKTKLTGESAPANLGKVRKARRRAPRRQAKVETPRNIGACRQQTGKREKHRGSEDGRRGRKLNVPLCQRANHARICVWSVVVMERVMQRTVRRGDAEGEQQDGQNSGQEELRHTFGRFLFPLHAAQVCKTNVVGKRGVPQAMAGHLVSQSSEVETVFDGEFSFVNLTSPIGGQETVSIL
jgi:hypothetical protein